MPAWTFRQAKSLDLCDLQRTETEQVVSYPLKAQKCLSIVPRGTEKAGKKSLTSYPLFVATCLSAVKLVCFQTFLIGGWQMISTARFLTVEDILYQRLHQAANFLNVIRHRPLLDAKLVRHFLLGGSIVE